MLPGFRFLFAAIVLSMSVLIFGLGAAALLRSAHEEFASLPSRRAPAEPVFTRQNDPPLPTLALLRFDPPVADDKPSENGPVAVAPETVTPTEQSPDAMPAEPEKLAALKPEEPMPAVAATLEMAAVDTTAAETVAPVANEDVKVAAIADAPEPSTTAATPAPDRLSLEGNIAATKIATLGGPAVTIANAGDAKPDRSMVRKRNAQRARERRRIAARRARLAAQLAAAAAQQLANPFGQTAGVRRTQ
ncbi:hypothetical protein FFI89_026585 [Bradyrhizobium sp. KBS0727]|uniref:hypothetical protein n=1 Tax=unclassified Bradyrhizobium TaxID=2631580 RepID=UPI00110D69D2|nr:MULTISPECIES: hypothetical protein [unclassified Bradyrhizobium]QDW40383.1 hypothetical protein FFI71_026590 [Bradyrhizobium sp. KBS0725]QDW46987.1 hypothetical protein FFI89_026585 [Bradyrhizobium sp. KBS0727]